ncbi:MAG: 50S ribosomal protein L25/general stress protein Ctc [Bacteroidia bacterium]|nr:50S ribosomal protein L25/general stress protein Ctc [Bacteroidia bacterium]
MKSIEINGVVRPALGKKGSKKERKELSVPCVLYGEGSENLHFSAHENQFLPLVYSHEVCTVRINVGGKSYNALLKDIQFHPVTDKILHSDFFLIHDEKKVNIGVPVHVNGFAEGVRAGGKLHLEHRKLKVKALLKHLPDHIDLDVTELGVGQNIRIGDIHIPNVELTEQKNVVVVSVKITRAAKEVEVAEAPVVVAPVVSEEPVKK